MIRCKHIRDCKGGLAVTARIARPGNICDLRIHLSLGLWATTESVLWLHPLDAGVPFRFRRVDDAHFIVR